MRTSLWLAALLMMTGCATPHFMMPAKLEYRFRVDGQFMPTISCPENTGATGFKVMRTQDGEFVCEMIYDDTPDWIVGSR